MTGSERPTIPVYVPSILAVDCPPTVLLRGEEAALGLGLLMRGASLDMAPAAALAREPLVLLVPTGVYALHGAEVDALVCISGASLVRVELDATATALTAMFESALRSRLGAQTRRTDAGVYSLVGQVSAEAPLSPRPLHKAGTASASRTSTMCPPRIATAPAFPGPISSIPPSPRSGERPRIHCDIAALSDEPGDRAIDETPRNASTELSAHRRARR